MRARRKGNERARYDGSKLTGYTEGPASPVQVLNTLMMKHLRYDTMSRTWRLEHQDDVGNRIKMQHLFLGTPNILKHEYGICNYKALIYSSLSGNQNRSCDSPTPVHTTPCHTSTFHLHMHTSTPCHQVFNHLLSVSISPPSLASMVKNTSFPKTCQPNKVIPV